jgi:hypothetical protein
MPKLSDYLDIAEEYATMAATRMKTSLHIAFVYGRGGILLGMCTNRVGSRSRGAGFDTHTIHAERAVLKMIGDVSLLRGAVLVVVRVGRGGNILGSAPCHGCRCHLEKAMDKYGLRKVYYS